MSIRTLAIASIASATAAAVTSQLWIAGTWIAAAVTPVLVTLLSEALHRPTERIAQSWPSERRAPRAQQPRDEPLPDAAGAAPPPPPDADALPARAAPEPVAGVPGPVRVYRQPAIGARRQRIALRAVVATAAAAFLIGIAAFTGAELLAGDSIGKGDRRTTLFSTERGDRERQDSEMQRQGEARDQPQRPADEPAEQPEATEPAPEEPPAEETTPTPPPAGEPAPGTPVPQPTPPGG